MHFYINTPIIKGTMEKSEAIYLGKRKLRRGNLTAVFTCMKNYDVEKLDISCIAPEGRTKTNGVKVQGGRFHYSVRK